VVNPRIQSGEIWLHYNTLRLLRRQSRTRQKVEHALACSNNDVHHLARNQDDLRHLLTVQERLNLFIR
jgi:hypothetical protein